MRWALSIPGELILRAGVWLDPGITPCVKTHTVAKCRKNNSPGRHHASRVQYDLTLKYAIPSRSFYARSKGWSFYTAKTHSRHGQDRNPAVQQSTAVSDVLSFRLSTAGGHQSPGLRTVLGKFGLFGESGQCCGSRQKPVRKA